MTRGGKVFQNRRSSRGSRPGRNRNQNNLPRRHTGDNRRIEKIPQLLEPNLVPLDNRKLLEGRDRPFPSERSPHIDVTDGDLLRGRGLQMNDMGFINPDFQRDRSPLRDEHFQRNRHPSFGERGQFPLDRGLLSDEQGEFSMDRLPLMAERGEFPMDRLPLMDDREFPMDRGPLLGEGGEFPMDRHLLMDDREFPIDRGLLIDERVEFPMDRGDFIDESGRFPIARGLHMTDRNREFIGDRSPHMNDRGLREENFRRNIGIIQNETGYLDDECLDNKGEQCSIRRDIDLYRDERLRRDNNPYRDEREHTFLRDRGPLTEEGNRGLIIDLHMEDREIDLLMDKGPQMEDRERGLLRNMGQHSAEREGGWLIDRGSHRHGRDLQRDPSRDDRGSKKPFVGNSRSETEGPSQRRPLEENNMGRLPVINLRDDLIDRKMNFDGDGKDCFSARDEMGPKDRALQMEGRGGSLATGRNMGIDDRRLKFQGPMHAQEGPEAMANNDRMISMNTDAPRGHNVQFFSRDHEQQIDKFDNNFFCKPKHEELFDVGEDLSTGISSNANEGKRQPSPLNRDRRQVPQDNRNRRNFNPASDRDRRQISPNRFTNNKMKPKSKSSSQTSRRNSPNRGSSRDKSNHRKSADRTDSRHRFNINSKSSKGDAMAPNNILSGPRDDPPPNIQMTVKNDQRDIQVLKYGEPYSLASADNCPSKQGQNIRKETDLRLKQLQNTRGSRKNNNTRSTTDRNQRRPNLQTFQKRNNSPQKDRSSEKHKFQGSNFRNRRSPPHSHSSKGHAETKQTSRWPRSAENQGSRRLSGQKESLDPGKKSVGSFKPFVKKDIMPTIGRGDIPMSHTSITNHETAMQQLMYKQLEILGLLNPDLQRHLAEKIKSGPFGVGTQAGQSNVQMSTPVAIGDTITSDKARFSSKMPIENRTEEVQPVKLSGISLTEADIDNFLKSKRDEDHSRSDDLNDENMETIKKSMLEFLMKMSKEQTSDGAGVTGLPSKQDSKQTRSSVKLQSNDRQFPKSNLNMMNEPLSRPNSSPIPKPGGSSFMKSDDSFLQKPGSIPTSARTFGPNLNRQPPNLYQQKTNEQTPAFPHAGIDSHQEKLTSDSSLPLQFWGMGTTKMGNEKTVQNSGLETRPPSQPFNIMTSQSKVDNYFNKSMGTAPISQQQNRPHETRNPFQDAGKRLFPGSGEFKNPHSPGNLTNQLSNAFTNTGMQSREQTMSRTDNFPHNTVVSLGQQMNTPTVHDWHHKSGGDTSTATSHTWNPQFDGNDNMHTPTTVHNWHHKTDRGGDGADTEPFVHEWNHQSMAHNQPWGNNAIQPQSVLASEQKKAPFQNTGLLYFEQ